MATPSEPLEGLAIQTDALNNLPNASTVATEHDEDEISLTSTAESVFQDEYEVETIHAQEVINGQRVYLVKWKGYDDLRCTWEPRDSFNTTEILQEWKNKKRQIRRGTRQPFDIEAWQAEIEAFENAREDRKRRRKAKRARLGLLGSGDHSQEVPAVPAAATPTADVEMTDPPPPTSEPPPDEDMSPVHRRDLGENGASISNSVQSKSPAQSRNARPNHLSKPSTAQPTVSRPVNQPTCRPERPKALVPMSVDIKLVDGRFERRDLANILNRARQQPNPPTEKSKPWKLFRTTYRFEKASQQDPEPNRGDLELQSPSAWSPFQMSSSLRKRQEEDDNSLFVEQDEIPETQQNSLPQTPAASTNSPVFQSQQLPTTELTAGAPSSIINRNECPQEIRESPSTENSDYTPRRQAPLGPKGWKPLMVGKRQLRRKDDLLCRISYGTEAVEIGETLLCDISTDAREMIFRLMYKSEIRVRFEEICTLDRFQSLAHEARNDVSFNGFILPYSDTQSKLFSLEDLLLENDLVAIARVCPNPVEPDKGVTLVCYPTHSESQSFQLLNRKGYVSAKGSLRFAGIYGILPRQLQDIAPPKDESRGRRLSERPERQGRYEEPGKTMNEGLVLWRPPSQSIPSTPRPDNSILGAKGRDLHARDPRLEASVSRKDQVPVVSQSAESNVVSNSGAAGANAISTSSPSSEKIKIITETRTPVSNDNDMPSPAPATSDEQHSERVIPETQDVQMLDVGNAGNIDLKKLLTHAFLNSYQITYQDIAAVTTHSGIKLTNCFYLWFPESADGDFRVLEEFLDQHYAIVLSNRKQNDWEKFTKSSSGVALFHHSFLHFSELPGFHKLAMSSSFNFWTVSLETAIPNIEPPRYFQRIFPHGTGYLMTEDFMLHERDAAIIVLAWFRDIALSKCPGTLKMMFRPSVLKWLDLMSKEDPRFAVMAVLIGDTACHGNASNWPVEARDLDYFYNPSLDSPVISLSEFPKSLYAKESSNPAAKATDQPSDTDHLCEVFAAWAILNAFSLRKFLILTHNKPMDRWQKWQHVEIIQGSTDFFRKSNISKEHYARWLAQGASTSSSSPSKSGAPELPAPSAGGSARRPSIPSQTLSTAPAPTAGQPRSVLSDRAAM